MLRLFTKLMALLVVLALAAPFVLKRPDGEPLVTAELLGKLKALTIPASPTDMEPLERVARETVAEIVTATTSPNDKSPPGVAYYRYKDTTGHWVFSDKPPVGVNAARIALPTASNILPASGEDRNTSLPEKPTETAAKRMLSVPAEAVPRLIEQAKAVREQANTRHQALERQVDGF